MNVIFDRGIYLADMDLWLDGRVKRYEGFISHAHSDHVARHHRALLTPATAKLLGATLDKSVVHTLPYGEPLETPGFTLTLYPAGHCLGSAQVLLVSKRTGERILYTGDLKLQPNPTAAPAQPVPCDTLIIESTYGQPEYCFPPQEEVLQRCYATLGPWLSSGRTPLLRAYRIGKAQEILFHLLSAGFDVALEASVWEIAERYQEMGISFPRAYRRLDDNPKEGEVVVRPPGRRRPEGDSLPGARTMTLTGWAVNPALGYRFSADEALPFSDHADFQGLVDYVSTVQPKRVFTVFGFPHLAAHLRRLGYEAAHLEGRAFHQQLRLL